MSDQPVPRDRTRSATTCNHPEGCEAAAQGRRWPPDIAGSASIVVVLQCHYDRL